MSTAPQARLYLGRVMHRRLRPAANRFAYRVFYLAVPLSRMESVENRWCALNRANVFSLRFADYGAQDGSHPLPWIRRLLAEAGVAGADGEVWLQTFPRVLGYVFNPVSFWYCEGRDGSLRAILCEVNNTFGERHRYLLAHPDGRPIRRGETLAARKVFHVSPFNPVAGGYRFRFEAPGDRSLARIEYHDAGGDVLHTSISGTAVPYTAAALARAFLAYPFMTVGVIARIHWQALRLLAKRVPFFSKPLPPVEQVTR
jgi:DUF1365 family protein